MITYIIPQYYALNALTERYADKPFKILGFPCNQFLRQVRDILTQGGYDGRGQRSCKCNYVDFYKDARPPMLTHDTAGAVVG